MSSSFLTIKEAAQVLGVHWQTVRNYIDQGKLPAHRMGKLVRILKEDLEAFSQQEQPPTQANIEYELRYLVRHSAELEKRLIDLGSKIAYQARVVDHWYLPKNITTREGHDQWFDTGRGCGIRIREQHNAYTGKMTTSLETKRLTQSLNHNTFLEAEVTVESYQKTTPLLEMMDLKEFLTIDKSRVMYMLGDNKISLDTIAGVGTCIEIEGTIRQGESREEIIVRLETIAASLGLSEKDRMNKSLTVLAMDTLAQF
jgi:predicted adenylyl cyclase CyaB